jgi:signal transduction histidine kinase
MRGVVADNSSTSIDRRARTTGDDATPGITGSVSGSVPRVRDSSRRARAEAWSLERRLPAMLSVLLACVVGGISLAAYREVRSTAISRATDRLERVGHELALSAVRNTAARTDTIRALAASDPIVRALASASPPVENVAEVATRIAASHMPSDSVLLGWRLADLAGQARFSSIREWSSMDSTMLASTVAEVLRTSSDHRSAMYPVDDRVHLWSVAPVRVDGRVAGTIAELRRIGDAARTEATIRQLFDDDVRITYTSRGTSWWVSPRGAPTTAPLAPPPVDDHAVLVDGADGSPQYAVQFAVPKSPWLILMYQSRDSVLHRPQEFLWRLLFAGVIVLAVASAGAWILSRHVTRPLREVTDAAAALAHGDYARRVRVRGGGREVASLSATFNAMAQGIGQAHAELADRNEELQQANAAKAQFLAVMSHELRTPLNAIGGFTELMELGLRGPVTPEQVEDLGRIRRNKDLLLAIITDILDFSRADAGALSFRAEPVAIATVLTDVADAVGRQMQTKGVRLVLQSVPADAIVRGDRERVQQVLLNLLSNALKFTESGGEVVVATTVLDGMVRIDVSDTGSGIGPAQLDAIFEPFVQVDASLTRRAGGTGLGLAIARQLASAMGGTVTVRSALGAGSTFSLTLPHADHGAPVLASGPRQPAGQSA